MPLSWRLKLRDLVQSRTGIVMRLDGGSGSMDRFVDARIHALSLSDRMDYVHLLQRETEEGPEFRRLISVVAIGQTYFFRDQEQFEAIGQILTTRAREKGGTVNVWSACCSTGQEPYSIAMLADSLQVPVRILGTDINDQAIEAARRGNYVEWTIRNVPREMRDRYLSYRDGRYAVKDFLRRRVRFERQNVVRHPPSEPSGRESVWDLILCRHAMVYFAQPTIELTARNLAQNLSADGFVFLGASESLHGLKTPLVPEKILRRIAYRRGEPRPRRATSSMRIEVPAAVVEAPPSFERAVRLVQQGDFETAGKVLEQVTEEHEEVRSITLLGMVRLQQHAFAEALEQFVEAQRQDPLLPELHYLQGVVYRKLGDLENATSALRRCLFLEPGFWPASFLLAGVYEREGRTEDQRRELGRTVEGLQGPKRDLFLTPVDLIPTLRLPRDQVARSCRHILEGSNYR